MFAINTHTLPSQILHDLRVSVSSCIFKNHPLASIGINAPLFHKLPDNVHVPIICC